MNVIELARAARHVVVRAQCIHMYVVVASFKSHVPTGDSLARLCVVGDLVRIQNIVAEVDLCVAVQQIGVGGLLELIGDNVDELAFVSETRRRSSSGLRLLRYGI